MPYKDPIKARESSKLRQRKFMKKPGHRERQNERMRELRKDPVFRAAELEKLRISRALPKNRLPRLEREREDKRKRKQFFDLLKTERGCYDCGGMFPAEALDWDHLPGTEKSFLVSRFLINKPRDQVLAEISKCQVVCATCHRIRTVNRRKEGK